MAHFETLTKAEIFKRMQRYAADPNKSLSWKFMAELSGLSQSLLRQIFVSHEVPMSEHTQICVSRALHRLEAGEVVVVYNRDRSRELKYRKESRPRMVKTVKLTLNDGKIGLSPRIRNKSDYSEPTLLEKLNGD